MIKKPTPDPSSRTPLAVLPPLREPSKTTLKYRLTDALRTTGILKTADWVKYCFHRLSVLSRNLEFNRNNPGFLLPPYDLAFDAYNNVDWDKYKRVGRLHASVIADIVTRNTDATALSILEWGCGPGRLIRHFKELLADRSLRLTGTDYNKRSIDWCRKILPDINFVHNGLMPPLDLESDQFDVVYNFSVFTHLSEDVQKAWAAEIWRVLKPGGLFISTTHGDNYRHLLTSKEEVDSFLAGHVVVKGRYVEGKKWYLAVHPEKFVREVLLTHFTNVQRIEVGEESDLLQDIWMCLKPSN